MTGNSGKFEAVAYEVAAKDAAWPHLPVIMADMATGTVVYCSEAAAAVFGHRAPELVGRCMDELIPQQPRPQRPLGFGKRMVGRRADGSMFPLHIGLVEMQVFEKAVEIVFVVDLSEVSDG